MSLSTESYSRLNSALCASHATTEIVKQLNTPTHTVSSLTGEVAQRFGATTTEGLETRVLEETVTLTNAVQTDLTNTIPAGAVILSVQSNLDTLVAGDASGDDLGVKVGIGVTADPDKYGLSSALTKNLKTDKIPDWAVLASAEQITVKLAQTDGSAATEKFVAGGIVRVRVVYLATNSLDDAA